jgi:hypothetical protein
MLYQFADPELRLCAVVGQRCVRRSGRGLGWTWVIVPVEGLNFLWAWLPALTCFLCVFYVQRAGFSFVLQDAASPLPSLVGSLQVLKVIPKHRSFTRHFVFASTALGFVLSIISIASSSSDSTPSRCSDLIWSRV